MGHGKRQPVVLISSTYHDRLKTSSHPTARKRWQSWLIFWKYVASERENWLICSNDYQEEVWPATRLAQTQLPGDPKKRWQTVIPIVVELKEKAKKLGLWNLFLSKAHYPDFGVPLTNLEVRHLTDCTIWNNFITRSVCCHGWTSWSWRSHSTRSSQLLRSRYR